MKNITKKRRKEIFTKNQEDMTVFEVLYSIPLSEHENLLSIINPRKLLASFKVKPFSRSKMYTLFDKPLTDSERILISRQMREIFERGLMAADLIENGLVER